MKNIMSVYFMIQEQGKPKNWCWIWKTTANAGSSDL